MKETIVRDKLYETYNKVFARFIHDHLANNKQAELEFDRIVWELASDQAKRFVEFYDNMVTT
jgi:predicted nucleic acid-binding OB-fold protein